MGAAQWVPFNRRNDPNRAAGMLHDGIPVWLVANLQTWVEERITYQHTTTSRRVNVKLLRRIERQAQISLGPATPSGDSERSGLLHLAQTGWDSFLGAVDVLLHELHDGPDTPAPAADLERTLAEAGSRYAVARGADGKWMLQDRIDDTVRGRS
jgi:hypothetical protein